MNYFTKSLNMLSLAYQYANIKSVWMLPWKVLVAADKQGSSLGLGTNPFL